MIFKGKKNPIKGVIFDLDGVLVSTDKYHCESWLQLAKDHGIYFDETINNRLRGLSRSESLEIFLERAKRQYSEDDKLVMAEKKNQYYLKLLERLSTKDVFPGVIDTLDTLQSKGIKVAIGSSSKNCPAILECIRLSEYFEVCIDGNQVSFGKPHPEIFLKAAKALALAPNECLVIEDGLPGIQAAKTAGMAVLGVGDAVQNEISVFTIPDLTFITVDKLLSLNEKSYSK